MDNLYTKISLNYVITIQPNEMNKNINKVLLKKLKNSLEGKCISDGYIKPNSIVITDRSLGIAQASHFNGNIMYHINYVADICNPHEGDIVTAKITNINKMGALATAGDGDIQPLNILLAKQHHIDNKDFDKLKIDDDIKVKILGKRFDSGESQISIIGVLDN